MLAFLVPAYAGLEWLPWLMVILGAGHLVGILALLLIPFPKRFEVGCTLGATACGCGIVGVLMCAIVFERCTLVGFLFAASPLLEGVAAIICFPKHSDECRGFEVVQSQPTHDDGTSAKLKNAKRTEDKN